jgi:hypothetical protein
MKNVNLSYLSRKAAAALLLVTSKSEQKAGTTKVNTETVQICTDMYEVRLLWRWEEATVLRPRTVGMSELKLSYFIPNVVVMRRLTTGITF